MTLNGGDPEARLRAQLATPRPGRARDTRGGPAGTLRPLGGSLTASPRAGPCEVMTFKNAAFVSEHPRVRRVVRGRARARTVQLRRGPRLYVRDADAGWVSIEGAEHELAAPFETAQVAVGRTATRRSRSRAEPS